MTRREAKRIIREENLEHYCFFKDRDERAEETGIKREGNLWCTYVTDERCYIDPRTKVFFETEEEALDHFIYRLRLYKRIQDSIRSRKAERIKEAKLRR